MVPSRARPSESEEPSSPDPTCGPWGLAGAEAAVAERLRSWSGSDAVGRIWRRDPTFWPEASPQDVASRLGWLLAPEQSASRVTELTGFAAAVREEGIEHVVLLGMGGSSLAADVMGAVLPRAPGAPRLTVLDSTHPGAVAACARAAPVDRTVFVVSSKSGTTLEPNAFFRFFWERAARLGTDRGRRFVAITDPGTPLEKLARERGFRACFAAPLDVGGRYSALTVFGLVPAALAGIDLGALLGRARAMVARCSERSDLLRNPGLHLGAALGELARAGRDKIVFLPSRGLRAFPAWAEQLVAESLGKIGRGIVPVGDPPPPAEFPRGEDAVYVHLAQDGRPERSLLAALEAREAAGAPVLRLRVPSPLDLGAEFFRWELAIAACGSVLGVNPFDQPDVEHAKELARAAMAPGAAATGASAPYGTSLADPPGLSEELGGWLGACGPGAYVAVQAFLAPSARTGAALERLAGALRRRLGVVVTLGYGPRFLHSTGQLHKGGPPSGRFLQIVDEPGPALPVPELGLSFAEIVRAEARGDRGALEEKHRRLLVVNAGGDAAAGVDRLVALVAGGSAQDAGGERTS